MPGMMDTVLNLGLNDATVEGLAAASRRRALRLGQLSPLHPDVFRRRARPRSRRCSRKRWRSPRRTRASISTPSSRPTTGRRWSAATRQLVEEELGPALPAGRRTSSSGARSARCSARGSPTAPRSIAGSTTSPATGAPRSTSRRWCSAIWARPRPPASPSPAIPSTGERAYYGEYLINAQGEDVVAGIRTPQYLTRAARETAGREGAVDGRGDARGLSPSSPAVFDLLERHYRDMQDIEFTVERGKLWMLQTRTRQAHRQGGAAGSRSTWPARG